MTERDNRGQPHGPERLPDEQPPPDPTDLTNQTALQHGAPSRWLVPSAVLAGVVVVLSLVALQLQLVIPIVSIVFVTVMWVLMFVASRRTPDIRRKNRLLAWLMGGMAVGAAILFATLYAVEASGIAG
ncbi:MULTISPECIES: hypothetical protein [unclassified Microbacterium]|uniref:hypothetical protein n=1 Tax=unclassified Microbacterium TaxID=2609290 RepID=UPI000C2C27EB|nr:MULTISPECIES: hypothetical protein [unclassified Microbacterium]